MNTNEIRIFLGIPDQYVSATLDSFKLKRSIKDPISAHLAFLEITNEGLREMCMERWLSLCKNTKQVAWAFENTLYRHDPEKYESLQRLAMIRWLKICKTSKQVELALSKALSGSYSETLAMGKCLKFCKTPKQAEGLANKVILGVDAHTFAEAKWDQLSSAQVRRSKTIRQVRTALRQSRRHSEAERSAMKKWDKISLVQVQKAVTPEKVKEAFGNAPHNGLAQAFAILKLSRMHSE